MRIELVNARGKKKKKKKKRRKRVSKKEREIESTKDILEIALGIEQRSWSSLLGVATACSNTLFARRLSDEIEM